MEFSQLVWLNISIVSTFATAVLLLFIFVLAMYKHRSRFARYWITGWAFYCIRFIFEFLSGHYPHEALFPVFSLIFSSLSGVTLFFAALSLVIRVSTKRYIFLFSSVFIIWILCAQYFHAGFTLTALPVFILLGIVQIITGIFFIKVSRKSGARIGCLITAVALIVWGIHKIDYPFLRHLQYLSIIGFQVGSFLQVVTGIGIITYLYQKTAKAHHESEIRFRAIFDFAPIGIMIQQSDLTPLICNHSYELITGYSFEFLSDKISGLCTHADDRDEEKTKIASIISSTAESYSLQKRIVCADGITRWIQSETVCIRIPNFTEKFVMHMIQDITPIKDNEESINRSLNEKNIMLKEIHHRVKNNLQIISSLLSLQQTIKESPKDSFNKARSRIKSIALIHEQLYSYDNFTDIHFSSHIKIVSEEIIKTIIPESPPVLIIEGDDFILHIDIAVPLGLIIHELILNAVKHAYADTAHPKLSITIRCHEQYAEIIVHDNGTGFCPEDTSTYTSLGMLLIRELSRQIKASVSYVCDGGTKVTLRIPYCEYPNPNIVKG